MILVVFNRSSSFYFVLCHINPPPAATLDVSCLFVNLFLACFVALAIVCVTTEIRGKVMVRPGAYTTAISPARSGRRCRSGSHFVCYRPSNAGSVTSGSHKLSHHHAGHPSSSQSNKRLPSYPSCKIRPSIAWRLLARTPLKRPLAWGRLIEALFTTGPSSWLSVRPFLL